MTRTLNKSKYRDVNKMLNPELYIVYTYPEQRTIIFEYGMFFYASLLM